MKFSYSSKINKDFYIDLLFQKKSRIMGFSDILCLLVLFPLRNVSLIERERKNYPARKVNTQESIIIVYEGEVTR